MSLLMKVSCNHVLAYEGELQPCLVYEGEL